MERMLRSRLDDLGHSSGWIFQRKVDLHWVLMADDLGDRLECVDAGLLASSKNAVVDLQLADRFQPFARRNRRRLGEAAVASEPARDALPSAPCTLPDIRCSSPHPRSGFGQSVFRPYARGCQAFRLGPRGAEKEDQAFLFVLEGSSCKDMAIERIRSV